MGRPRKPTAILELNGTLKAHPERARARANEPKPNGSIGEPPDYFDQTHRAVWAEYVDESPRGVLTKADRKILELAVRLTCKMRFDEGRMPKWLRFLGKALEAAGMDEDEVDEMKEAMNAAVGCSSQEIMALNSMLTKMGMTPADRSRVTSEKPKDDVEDDPLTQLAAGKGRAARPN